MATSSGEQRVTDELTEERLTFIETHFNGPTVLQLAAEVRASRAREAELAVELQHVLDTLRQKRTEIIDITDERDVLQQRIDKARQLTVRQFIGPARFKAEGYERTVHEIAAALTGTGPDDA